MDLDSTGTGWLFSTCISFVYTLVVLCLDDLRLIGLLANLR